MFLATFIGLLSENNDYANITEASFCYKDNFCSVDILRKINDSYEIYEVKSSTEIKDIYNNKRFE